MKVSYKWIKELTGIKVDVKDFVRDITMSGSKVENLYCPGDEITGVVTGKILLIEKHPNADKLVVCRVDVGQPDPVQICTAATNLYEGAYIPVALAGATLANGLKIKKGIFRGVESNGMLCSLGELTLTKNDFPDVDENGIMIIDECELGLDIRPILGLDDTCVEFEITPNRPDCLTVSGLARETAATYGKRLNLPEPKVRGSGDNIENYVDVSIQDKKGCVRYIAKVIKNIKIEPSPAWLRERLRMCGVRPINNFVDITNYVMLEYHPMHAFDLSCLDGDKIVVRRANGEKITALDGSEHTLDDQILMICDAQKPVAVAGIMGGEHSGVKSDTQTVVFESACFDGPMVRAASRKLGMRTESSMRFEKGLYSEICYTAIMRACELVEELGAGEVVDGIIDIKNDTRKPPEIEFDPGWINKVLGTDISVLQMEQILENLEMKIENGVIIPPGFRKDLEGRHDIAEEIARIYGYDNIPSTTLKGAASAGFTKRQIFRRTVNQTALSAGLNEVATYSFISPKSYDKILMPQDDICRKSVVIRNPLGEDTSVMRTTLLPSMLEVISKNYNNRNLQGGFYEIGTEYFPAGNEEISENNLPEEIARLAIGIYGDDADFYELKGITELILDAVGIKNAVYKSSYSPSFHPHKYAKIFIGGNSGEQIGFLGEIHPFVPENYDIGTKCLFAKLFLDKMFEFYLPERTFVPLPKYPSVTRDITFICDEREEGAKFAGAIERAVGNILESVAFLYSYRGEQIPDGKKSMSYSVTMRSESGTLTDEEADKAIKRAVKSLSAMGAERR
ncbi:MAG: phenylalanine--tRNA ligase subunit beta [Oscillospiraceae bacterium]|nr:phenylalanine--tRNA ligase subunit beta [Oscillospiraceae bacterium]